MPHQHLWAVGSAWKSLIQAQHLGHRYRWLHSNVFLDLQPEQPPEPMAAVPDVVLPYLRLSGYSRHMPRLYAVLTELGEQILETPVLLLDQAAIAPSPAISNQHPQLLPALSERWPKLPPLTQINLLWQLASLWEPLQSEQVVSTLFVPELIRLDGTTVRLLELQADAPGKEWALSNLARHWHPLVSQAHKAVAPYLQNLGQRLQAGEYSSIEQLLISLERGLRHCGVDQTHNIQMATRTDQGPTRKRNEDACFPASGTATTYGTSAAVTVQDANLPPVPFLIVCDGIGGHEGGDVASKLAIQGIQSYLMPLLKTANPEPAAISQALKQAICVANDEISQRNDLEQRQAQGRMGTTVVVALVLEASLYLAHLGDSRAYRVTAQSCRQITVDDDVASREVRLGYGLYREVLYHPSAGSLVQALGMTSSERLYPTVQRFVLDENCLILLCSDGLSDNDLVENSWSQSLLPLFKGQQSLSEGSQALIELANTHNGHDNVTVGLLRVQVTRAATTSIDPAAAVPSVLTSVESQPGPARGGVSARNTPVTTRAKAPAPTQSFSPRQSKGKPWGLITLGVIGFGAIASVLAFSVGPELLPLNPRERATPLLSSQPPLPPFTPFSETTSIFEINRLLQVTQASVEVNGETQPLKLYADPEDSLAASSPNSANPEKIEKTLPAGSILQVLTQREVPNQPRWVRLQVCSVPSGASLGDRPAESDTPTVEANPVAPGTLTQLSQPGDIGWISATILTPVVRPLDTVTPAQQGDCES